jgi:outer membrane protein assembly factor BamB
MKAEMWGSTFVADGKVYAGDQDGDFIVLAASKEKKVISETNLGSSVYGTAVVANGMVFIQSNTHLFAFSNGAAKVPRPD